jgi:hypothetical protein
MSTQYHLVQSGKTASGGCSAGQGSSEPVAPWIYFILSRCLSAVTFTVEHFCIQTENCTTQHKVLIQEKEKLQVSLFKNYLQ